MRTTYDTLASVRDYMGEVFGEEWRVRLDTEQGAVSPPLVTVAQNGAAISVGPANESTQTLPLTITAEPMAALSGESAAKLAAELEEVFYTAFRVGIGDGRPNRIPLWNYDDEAGRKRSPHDYLRVVDWNAQTKTDNNDTRRIAVVAELRVTWRRATRVVLEPQLVVGVHQVFVEED